jgi:sterol desaturase/sphingolipid hydroxylase (fatty acid hydroxylase superfamily)
MNALLDYLARASPLPVIAVLLAENVILLLLTVALGELLVRCFRHRRNSPPPPPISREEISLAVLCVLMNTLVTIAGWWLWRTGIITLRRDIGWRTLLDVAVLIMAMDFGMYVTHRIAHIEPIFRILHSSHHRYDHPRPLNLFVLHPGEVLGFGGLWLIVMWAYPASWLGTSVYLTLNLMFGMTGHLGVEPLPRSWPQWLILRHIGTSTFHAEHHVRRQYNFGFYTLLWDRLFGTLDPEYGRDFQATATVAPVRRV